MAPALRALLLTLLGASLAAADAARQYYYEDPLTPFFARESSWVVARRPGADTISGRFPAHKAPGTFRVFVVGGSIALAFAHSPMGSVPARAVRRLTGDRFDTALRLALPGRRVELVNCGMAGYDSFRERRIVDEVLGHEPDLIVLMSGHNEGLGSPPPTPATAEARRVLSRLPGYAWLEGRAGRRLAAARPGPRDALQRDGAFLENLLAMLSAARARKVPVVVLRPPLNYRDAAPLAEAPVEEPRFWEGRARFLSGDLSGAGEAWAALAAALPADDDRRAVPLFLAARASDGLGRYAEARRRYEAAVDADWLSGHRCGGQCAAILADAARREGAALADADAALGAYAAPRMPGAEAFMDIVHWTRDRDGLVARAILRAARRTPRLAGLPWDDRLIESLGVSGGWLAPIQERNEASARLKYALEAVGARRPGLSWRAVGYSQALLARDPRTFDDVDALVRRLSEGPPPPGRVWGARPSAPQKPVLLWHLAEARAAGGDLDRAAADLASALRLDPGETRPDVALSLALVQSVRGERDAAARSLADAAGAGRAAQARALEAGLAAAGSSR